MALDVLGPAWERFNQGQIAGDARVRDRFSAGDYRSVARLLKAYAVVQQAVTDFQSPRPEPVPIRKTLNEWTDFARQHTGVHPDRVPDVLDLLLHAGTR